MNRALFFYISLLFFLPGYSQNLNTPISNGVLFDGEPYLAINPSNNQNLVAAWMGLKYSNGLFRIAIKTRASFDGGNSWSPVTIMPHFGNGFGAADVSMAFNKNGLLFISYIDYKQAPDSGGIYVARSLNGGLSWDTPSKAFDMYDVAGKRAIDRPWLVVDNSNTSNFGTLYITSKPAPWIPPPNRNYFKVSSDSGHTWTSIANIDGGSYLVGNLIPAPMAAPTTMMNGKFCAIYPSYVPAQNPLPAYYFAKSADKGLTFSYTTVFTAIPAANDTNLKNGYQLIAHPTDSNKLIFLTPDAQNGDADIKAFHSNDGGLSWSNQVRVNDDAVSNGKAQDMVWVAYNEQGNLAVTWRDRRNSNGNGFWNAGYDFYYALSADNGQTFSTNKLLTSQFVPFDSIIAQSGNDFMSCVFSSDTLYSLWGDTRNGKMNIYFSKTIASTNTGIFVKALEGEEPPFVISPNPASSMMNVRLNVNFYGTELFILDANGQQVMAVNASKYLSINISELPKGIYFIQLKNQPQSSMKFIKE